jgi:hypothetical protein
MKCLVFKEILENRRMIICREKFILGRQETVFSTIHTSINRSMDQGRLKD